MKNISRLAFIFFAISFCSCGKKASENDKQAESHSHQASSENVSNDPNKTLYDSIMAVHDEAMPKLEDIFRLTESLKDKVARTPDMPASTKEEIEAAIGALNNASEGMMVWMRKFSPITDTTNPEAARDYLKQEMVKVEKVRSDILNSIEKGKALQ